MLEGIVTFMRIEGGEMKNKLGYKIKEWKLVDKYGEYHYKTGTKYEVAAYALENQLLMVKEGE
jgi:hypothetical protein